MCSSRALVLALFAAVALVSCNVPENAIVRESEPLVEVLVQAPHDEADEPNGVITTDSDETEAHSGPNNSHSTVECLEGQILCSNGSCAETCDELSVGGPGFDYTFRPNPTKLGAPPSVAGRQEDYKAEAENYLGSQTDAEQRAVTAAEQSAGLGFASHDAALDEETQRNAAEKLKVEKLMNIAAAHAADFKSKSAAHDVSVANVKSSKIEEQKQEAVVATAEATLKQEKDNLKKSKEHVTAMENEEQNRRYQAEFAGQQYEHAKAEALKADNDLQESIHETEEKDKFRQVARAAVEKAAKAELKAVHEKTTPAVPAAPANGTDATCEDCTTLPAIYTDAGGKCSDCPNWAARGDCNDPEYSKFMARYCAKSCGCPEQADAAAAQLAAVNAPQMPQAPAEGARPPTKTFRL